MLVRRVCKFILNNQLLQNGDTVIVGTSGGADSTALLKILNSSGLNLKLVAVYVDHGLRPDEVGREISLLQHFCSKLTIPFHSTSIDVKGKCKKDGSSIEEAARLLRYETLEQLRTRYQAQAIAVGHTADDQVEELFIRMIRGCGLKGLCGMMPKNGSIVRPLLEERKSSLISYLNEKNISYCQDSSNTDQRFLRNRVRNQLLPHLENEFNPSIRKTILQLSSILSDDEALLDEIAEAACHRILQSLPADGRLSESTSLSIPIESFLQEHTATQRRLLEKALWRMGAAPSFRTIERLQEIIHSKENGRRIHLPDGLRAVTRNGMLIFSFPAGRSAHRGNGIADNHIEEVITAEGSYPFPSLQHQLSIHLLQGTIKPIDSTEVLYIDADKACLPFRLTTDVQGLKMRPLGAPGRKKISRIFTDLKIAPEERHKYPVLISNNEVVALLGLRIDERFKLTKQTETTLIIEWKTTP